MPILHMSSFPLQLQQVHAIGIQSFACTEYRNDDGQSNGGFRGGDHHDKEDEDLTAQGVPVRGERHEAQVHGVEHQLDRHEDRDDVALDEKAEYAAGEEDRAEREIVRKRNHWLSLRARTTAPMIAIRISTE